jgi:hypothetical protein
MKRRFLFLILSLLISRTVLCQVNGDAGVRILFHGVVMDATTLSPVTNTQIFINRDFTSVSGMDGTFAFFVNQRDSVIFRHIGYKPTTFTVSDTLAGKEFIAGIYMNSDTLSIGEVIIVPRFINLKSEIMNAPSKVPTTMENAKYNVAISAYQGRTTTGKLGDPASNYGLIKDRQKISAQERGGIPSDRIVGLSPLLLVPAAYLLIHGAPEKPAPYDNPLTNKELQQLNKMFLESLQEKK